MRVSKDTSKNKAVLTLVGTIPQQFRWMEAGKSCLLFWLYLQSMDMSHGQTLQHPSNRGRYFREDTDSPV